MTDTYPDWLERNCSGIDFGAQPQVVSETERYALVKVPGHWTSLGAHGQEYIAVSYMIVAKTRKGHDITGWYRTVSYGRADLQKQMMLTELLTTAEANNTLPDRANTPHLKITNRR